MIQSKIDYKNYLEQDKKALGIKYSSLSTRFINFLSPNYIWKFQKALRKVEYYLKLK